MVIIVCTSTSTSLRARLVPGGSTTLMFYVETHTIHQQLPKSVGKKSLCWFSPLRCQQSLEPYSYTFTYRTLQPLVSVEAESLDLGYRNRGMDRDLYQITMSPEYLSQFFFKVCLFLLNVISVPGRPKPCLFYSLLYTQGLA